MEKYQSNSKKARETREAKPEKFEKVIIGEAKTIKKKPIAKVTDFLLSEDVSSVKTYISNDIVRPAVKKAISDILTTVVDSVKDAFYMALFGEKRSGGYASRVSYSSLSGRGSRERSDREVPWERRRSSYLFDDIVVETRNEAESVLRRMDELIESYGTVSVADLHELVGKTGEYTDNKYGWTDLRTATFQRCYEGGYLLKFPRALPLD